MFPLRFFGARYFATRYFGRGTAIPPYVGMVRLTAARGFAFAFTAGSGPAVRLTPREPST